MNRKNLLKNITSSHRNSLLAVGLLVTVIVMAVVISRNDRGQEPSIAGTSTYSTPAYITLSTQSTSTPAPVANTSTTPTPTATPTPTPLSTHLCDGTQIPVNVSCEDFKNRGVSRPTPPQQTAVPYPDLPSYSTPPMPQNLR